MADVDRVSTTFLPGATLAEFVIDRPSKRNPVSARVLSDLLDALSQCDAGGQRVLLLRGASGFFSSGADLAEVTGTATDGAWFELMGRVGARLASANLVSIAAIEGGCLGSGVDLATACDIRVAATDAYFALPTIDMGVVYRPETYRRLAGLAGPTTVARLAVLGERITAGEAHQLGLVTQLADDPIAAARRLANRLTTLSPVAVRETVRMLAELTDAGPIADHWTRAHKGSLTTDARRAAVSFKRASLDQGTT